MYKGFSKAKKTYGLCYCEKVVLATNLDLFENRIFFSDQLNSFCKVPKGKARVLF